MTVLEELDQALQELAGTARLLVALDFDGTLAPEVDDPELARALPESRAAVLRLVALPDTRVAFVSGRALDSLIRVSDPAETTLLVGSHGVEVRLDDPGDRPGLDADELHRLARLHELLTAVAEETDGAWVEDKPAGFALHTRQVADAEARCAQDAALERTETELGGLTVRRGKNVLEFSVRSATKGESIELLRRHTGADAVFYAGDDVTDEDAFRALGVGDVGLKIGAGETAARFRVDGPADVPVVLARLADLRHGAGIAT